MSLTKKTVSLTVAKSQANYWRGRILNMMEIIWVVMEVPDEVHHVESPTQLPSLACCLNAREPRMMQLKPEKSSPGAGLITNVNMDCDDEGLPSTLLPRLEPMILYNTDFPFTET